MRVCYFGIYDPHYSRNGVLMTGFRRLGHEVVECRVDPRENGGFKKYFALKRAYDALADKKFDLVIVGFPGHTVALLARILFGPKIIFDMFLSLYDSNVGDRALYGKYDPRAWRDWFFDWISMKLANRILLDTNAHIEYVSKTFRISKEKFVRVLVGTTDEIFFSRAEPPAEPFTVHFHGMFIPLQGIQYILEAAAILRDEDIQWNIVGKGQTYEQMTALAKKLALSKVTFIDTVPTKELPSWIARGNVCLGVFGNTDKAKRVIPNKVYECAAMGKPIITADTPAVREVFTDGKEVVFCPAADARGLAVAIKAIRAYKNQRERVRKGAYELYRTRLMPEHVVTELLKNRF